METVHDVCHFLKQKNSHPVWEAPGYPAEYLRGCFLFLYTVGYIAFWISGFPYLVTGQNQAIEKGRSIRPDIRPARYLVHAYIPNKYLVNNGSLTVALAALGEQENVSSYSIGLQ